MKAKAYKLTDETGRTYGGMQWGKGVEHSAPGGEPCSKGVIHWYEDARLAVFFDPIHGRFGPGARLWECDVDQAGTDGTKSWGTRCRTIREIEKPVITTEQRVEVAIRCAMKVCHDSAWSAWAKRWLSGSDRSEASAMSSRCDAKSWFVAGLAVSAELEAAWAASEAAVALRGHAFRRQAVATTSAEAVAWSVKAKVDVLDVINSVMEGN